MEKDERTKEDIEKEIFLMRYAVLLKELEAETGEKIDLILGCSESDEDWRQGLRKNTQKEKK